MPETRADQVAEANCTLPLGAQVKAGRGHAEVPTQGGELLPAIRSLGSKVYPLHSVHRLGPFFPSGHRRPQPSPRKSQGHRLQTRLGASPAEGPKGHTQPAAADGREGAGSQAPSDGPSAGVALSRLVPGLPGASQRRELGPRAPLGAIATPLLPHAGDKASRQRREKQDRDTILPDLSRASDTSPPGLPIFTHTQTTV